MDRSRSESLRRDILQRLYDRLSSILERQPVDGEGLQFACHHYLVLLGALGDIVDVGEDILSALSDLNTIIQQERDNQKTLITVHVERGSHGRPRLAVSREALEHLVEMGLPTSVITKLLGVSRVTLFRRMSENNIFVSATYSKCSDEELDSFISVIKSNMPDAGYRVVRGALLAQGHRVQWDRLYASMHRVDSAGVLAQMTCLGCVVRKTYTVLCPKYMVHIDTNHKLISEAVNEHGFPLRVRGDHGRENVGVAELLFSVRGTDTNSNSFIAGKSVHNQRPAWMSLEMRGTTIQSGQRKT
uniref:Integrase core domain-containing protein n=1 Tax=Nothobranchius rachovii TaxID=451742 RepID=A0A1A8S4R2_9TELE